ncbi:MAG: TIGR03905 family TSCPD domain-containing protein [Firmicutes bacterium]|nr:TIGR03905 family TSCPD domain-containing protein [Bacillota bacterium]
MESFRTAGTCAKQIIFDVQNNTLVTCKFINGCSGNAQGIARLSLGQNIDYIIEKLSGIQCRQGTSCPDQLAKALIDFKVRQAAKA